MQDSFMYMQISGGEMVTVKGDVQGKGFQGRYGSHDNFNDGSWFEVGSLAFTLRREDEEGAATQGAAHGCKLDDVSFSKSQDSASTGIFDLVRTNEQVTVKVRFVKSAAKGMNVFVEYDFEECHFTSYAPSGRDETVNFTCRKVKYTFIPYDQKDKQRPGMHTEWVAEQEA